MRRIAATFVLAGLVAVCGCASLHVEETLRKMGEAGSLPAEEGLARVSEGETTRQELLDLLGPPALVRPAEGGGKQFIYHYVARQTEVHTVIPIKKSTRVMHSMLVVTFDVSDGVVTGVDREHKPLADPDG